MVVVPGRSGQCLAQAPGQNLGHRHEALVGPELSPWTRRILAVVARLGGGHAAAPVFEVNQTLKRGPSWRTGTSQLGIVLTALPGSETFR